MIIDCDVSAHYSPIYLMRIKMFWIFKKKSLTKFEFNARKPFTALYDGDARFLHNMTIHGAELRVWLPTTISVALGDVSHETNQTVSAYLREFFAFYLYGAHDFIRMQKEFTGVFYDVSKHPIDFAANQEIIRKEDAPLFSRRSNEDSIPDLGKNIVPIKVYIPEKIKEDLQMLADKAGLPMSTFLREVLASSLLGHTFWADCLVKPTASECKQAKAWENADS